MTYEVFKKYYETWQKKVQIYESKNKEVDILPVLNEFFKMYGITFTETEAIELYRILYHQTFANAQLEPFVPEALYELRKEIYKTGIISNMPIYGDVSIEIFKGLNIETLFDYYLFSYDIRTCKPSLEIFKRAILDNKIPAAKSIMIGDSLKNDYFPAQQVGINPILYSKIEGHNSFDSYKHIMKKVKKYERN